MTYPRHLPRVTTFPTHLEVPFNKNTRTRRGSTPIVISVLLFNNLFILHSTLVSCKPVLTMYNYNTGTAFLDVLRTERVSLKNEGLFQT